MAAALVARLHAWLQHVRPADAPGRFGDLMGGDADLEELVTDNVLQRGAGGNVKLGKEGRQGRAEGRLTFTNLQEFYSMGATVVFDQLERLWPPITELARNAQQWSTCTAHRQMP